jgi:hypothetical protein
LLIKIKEGSSEEDRGGAFRRVKHQLPSSIFTLGRREYSDSSRILENAHVRYISAICSEGGIQRKGL